MTFLISDCGRTIMLITLIIFILWFKSEQKAADKWFSRVFHTFDSLLLIKETELIVIIVKMGKTLEGCPGTTPQAHMTLTFDTEATMSCSLQAGSTIQNVSLQTIKVKGISS